MLTIWGRLNSHNVKKVAWAALEMGVAHVRHDVGGAFGMDDAYRAKNPNALIPTIEEDGLTLWESNAILRYMAARHGGDAWWPSDPAARVKNFEQSRAQFAQIMQKAEGAGTKAVNMDYDKAYFGAKGVAADEE